MCPARGSMATMLNYAAGRPGPEIKILRVPFFYGPIFGTRHEQQQGCQVFVTEKCQTLF